MCLIIFSTIILLRNNSDNISKLNPKPIVLILASMAFICILLTFLSDPLGFGNGRGVIWKISLAKFKYFSLKNFLLGTGPENLNSLYSTYSFQNKMMLTTSHSEPIQILLTMGTFGFSTYLYILIKLFQNITKNIKKGQCQPYALAIIAYLGQSLVNSATVPNVLILVTVVAIFLKSAHT